MDTLLDVLKKIGVISGHQRPINPYRYRLESQVQILEIPKESTRDFAIYDNVRITPGGDLMQDPGKTYIGLYSWEQLHFDVREIEKSQSIGNVKSEQYDFYIADKNFVENLDDELV